MDRTPKWERGTSGGDERQPRIRGFQLMSLTGVLFGLAFVPVNWARGAPQVAALDGLMAGLLVANVLLFRRTGKVELHGFAALAIVVLSLLPMTFQLGAQIYLWFAAVPPLAFFMLGLTRGALFAGTFLAVLGAWLYSFPPNWKAGQFPVALLASLLLMTLLGYIYERAKHHYARELRILSSVDALTGCFNRREGARILALEQERVERYGRPLSVILIDIDHFKRINDEHGHGVGDRVLRKVAARARNVVRRNDSVVRWGGEEFLVILPETDTLGARAAAQRLLHRISGTPIDPVGTVTVSAGATQVSAQRDGDLRRTLQRADALLYEAKRTGRNRVCVDVVTPDSFERPKDFSDLPAAS